MAKASSYFDDSRTGMLQEMAAGLAVDQKILGLNKLKAFAAAAKYTGLLAIGLDIAGQLWASNLLKSR